MKIATTIVTLIASAGIASAQATQEFRLFDNGSQNNGFQVEVGGVGTSPFFMNAQGSNGSNQFAEFYIMQFDLSTFNLASIGSVEIDLTHNEPFFASSGGVSLDYTADDATDPASLAFDQASVGGNNGQLAASDVADWTFNTGNDGTTFTYSLSDNGGLFADIQSAGVIRLILEATDPGTAATYEGFDGDFGAGGPVLRVTEIPTPGGAAVLGLAGLAAARRRR
jgi:MYXO-CTERM domain-containing protein